MSKKIIYYLKPSSFCFGVERAIDMLDKIIEENTGEKIYCIHEIVHNPGVVKDFENKGIIFVDNIEDVKEKNVIVVFSAHGIDRETLAKSEKNFKKTYNLECPLVTKVYKEVDSFQNIKKIFYIGKKGHQETIGIENYVKSLGKEIYIFLNKDEIPDINKDENIGVISQTTLNFLDVKNVLVKIKEIYKNAKIPIVSDICKATFERQSVIKNNLDKFESLIVIGGKTSSNTKELYKIGEKAGKKSYFGERLEDVLIYGENELLNSKNLAITGGASTPFKDISLVYEWFVKRGYKLEIINL